MRQILFAFTALLVSAPALADRAVVDCGKASRGEVTITLKNARMSHERAADLAFRCYRENNAELMKMRSDALKAAKEENELCGAAESLQIFAINSWIADRIDQYGQSGGDSTMFVREPLICDGVGTGLFGGVISNTTVAMKITETYKADMNSKTSRQVMIINLEGGLDLVVKKKSGSTLVK